MRMQSPENREHEVEDTTSLGGYKNDLGAKPLNHTSFLIWAAL